MILKLRIVLVATIILTIVSSCNRGPKVISSDESENSDQSTGVFTDKSSDEIKTIPNQALSNEMHKIVVLEILPTTKYVYLKVEENDLQFWIATIKQEINVGGTYFYKGGLLKTNFESKEHNKIFDKIYLVTSLVQASHGNDSKDGKLITKEPKQKDEQVSMSNTSDNNQKSGSIKIAELVENFKKYEGKTVQISGRCVKINPNIMGRNWIHIKDGSKDDYDLVITSDTFVEEGTLITMKATVSLNKDFGAGYKYDLILENGTIVP